MPIEPKPFLSFSSTGWSAISSIITFSAVLVALFLPFYYERKKKTNLSNLIEDELRRNIELLNKANSMQDRSINGQPISKLNMMCPILENLDQNIWNDNKQTIAEISSKRFLKYSVVANLIETINSHAKDIITKKGQSPYSAIIEGEIKKCLQLNAK